MTSALTLDEFKQLEASWIGGVADPNAGGGTARGLGSVYLRHGTVPTVPTELYVKLGASNVGWARQNLVNLRIFNILDYGAVGDGVTDCRAAIVAAMTAANAAGGGSVYIPPAVLGYAVGPNPNASLVGSIEASNIHNVAFVGDGYNSWLKLAGDYLTHSTVLFHVFNGSTRVSFFNFRCNGQNIVNPNATNQNHYIQVSSTGTAGDLTPPSDCDIKRMWFDPVPGCALRIAGEGVLNGQRVSDVRFLYNAVNTGDGAALGRSCVEALRNNSRIQIIGNWMGPVSPTQAGQNIDFEPSHTAPDRWLITANTIVSVNQFSVTLSGVDSPRDPSIRNQFNYNLITGTAKGGVLQAGAQPTLMEVIGNIITCQGVAVTPTAVLLFRNLNQSIISENVAISIDSGGVVDRFAMWVIYDPPGDPVSLVVEGNLFKMVASSTDSALKFDAGQQLVFSDNSFYFDASGATPNGGVTLRPGGQVGRDWLLSGNLVSATAGTVTSGLLIECAGSNDVHNVVANHNIIGTSINGILWDSTTFAMLDWRSCNGNVMNSTSQMVALPASLVGVTFAGTAGANAQGALSGLTPTGRISANPGSFCMNTTGGVATTLSIKESGVNDTAGWFGDGAIEMVFGTLTANVTTTSQYIAPGQALPQEIATEIKVIMPRPGAIRNMRLRCTPGAGGGNNTWTVRRNGVDTGLTLTVANNAAAGTGNTNAPVFAAGDTLSIRTSKSLAPGIPQTNIKITLEITS